MKRERERERERERKKEIKPYDNQRGLKNRERKPINL